MPDRLRSALTSHYGLLGFTGDLLKQNLPSRQTGSEPTVEQLAIAMLDTELRPFLTLWLPRNVIRPGQRR